MLSGVILFQIVGNIAAAAAVQPTPTPALPPRPHDTDWDAYKKINTAIATAGTDEKQKTKRFTEAEVMSWMRVQNWLDEGKQNFDYDRLRVGLAPSNYKEYHGPYVIRDLKAFKETPFSSWAQDTAAQSANTGLFANPKDKHWQGIKFRQSYTEVLGIEDPSQDSTKKVDTLQGGLFSYTKNYLTDGDSWSFQGAFLFPFVWQIEPRLNDKVGLVQTSPLDNQMVDMDHWAVLSYGVIPSVSIYRVTNVENIPNTTLKKDVDQLTFRVGVFDKLSVPGQILDTMTLRGFATFLTDTGFETSIPAGQLEWEPQAHFARYLNIGYLTQLIPKTPTLDRKGDYDYTDTSYLAYQLRFRAHADYGTIIDSNTHLETGGFFRAGPIVDFRLDPFVFKTVNIGFTYEYLPAISGDNNHNSLFTASGEWKIAKNPKTQQSLSLKLTYTDGGIDITKQQVRTLVAGLGGTW